MPWKRIKQWWQKRRKNKQKRWMERKKKKVSKLEKKGEKIRKSIREREKFEKEREIAAKIEAARKKAKNVLKQMAEDPGSQASIKHWQQAGLRAELQDELYPRGLAGHNEKVLSASYKRFLP